MHWLVGFFFLDPLPPAQARACLLQPLRYEDHELLGRVLLRLPGMITCSQSNKTLSGTDTIGYIGIIKACADREGELI